MTSVLLVSGVRNPTVHRLVGCHNNIALILQVLDGCIVENSWIDLNAIVASLCGFHETLHDKSL
jgi:hypothetical protein